MDRGATTIRTCILLVWLLAGAGGVHAQTASTGGLTGTVTDLSGGVIPGARVAASNEGTGEIRAVSSQYNGAYLVPFLPAGSYRVEVERDGFKVASRPGVVVNVTVSTRFDVQLEVGPTSESVVVSAQPGLLQTESPALGGLTDERAVTGLPLANRNFTQIMNLYPGISTNVNNATALGRGGGGVMGVNNANVNGATVYDNNFQMNGVGANDLLGSGSFSGGIPIPNADAIHEFKVQTGLYDAAYGRNAGAHVDVITRSGSNEFHGNTFEFLRNEVLNGNSFFRNRNSQPRGVLRQNQFGGTLGGPIRKDKLFFFLSYQGTRQRNGVAGGGASNFRSPPLTNDRSREGIGRLFAGKCGLLDRACAYPIAADGSNISAPALNLLNLKLSNGQYLLPAPQTINPGSPFDTRGFTALSVPAWYREDQGLAGIDYIQSAKSSFKLSYFHSGENMDIPLPAPNFGGAPVEGFPLVVSTTFQNLAVAHTYTFTPTLVNHAIFGLRRIDPTTIQETPFHYSDIGVTAPPNADPYPQIFISGAYTLGGNGQGGRFAQNTYTFTDSAFYVHGRHNLRFGGEIDRAHVNLTQYHFLGALVFLSFEDFLLGQSGAKNGTGIFSNVYLSSDLPGLFDRAWRTWDGSLYVQDDIRWTSTFTVNLGLRYERLGGIGEELGRNANFDPERANPTPPREERSRGSLSPITSKGLFPPA
ncbi:MAG: TonB-dependent receptor [Bryobacterales bacterium]|nr:TonB-dependent receptor [Bryobacterales bacterium]